MRRSTLPLEDRESAQTRGGRARRLASRVLRESLLLALFLAVAVVDTWPLAKHLDSAVSDAGDPLLNTWILDWSMHALTTNPLGLFDAPMFAGAKYPLAFSEHLVGIAVLVLPFKLAGATPLVAYNIAMLIGFTLSAYGASVLSRTLGASLPASVGIALTFAFGQFFFSHLSHLQIVSSGWLPVTLAALILLLRESSWRNVILFAAAFTMNSLTNIYWMLFAGFASVATVAFHVWVDPAQRDPAHVRRIATSFGIAALILLPFLIPYYLASHLYRMERSWAQVQEGSAYLIDYARGAPPNLFHGQSGLEHQTERDLATGLLPLILGAVTLLLTRRRDNGVDGAFGRKAPSTRLLRWIDGSAVALGILGYIAGTLREGIRFKIGSAVLVPLASGSVAFFLMFLLILWRCSLRMPDVLSRGELRHLPDLIRRSRFWPDAWTGFLWIIIGVLGSFGAHAFLHGFLFHTLAPFRAIRVTARWAVIAYVGLVVVSSLGTVLIFAGRSRRMRAALALGIALVVVLDTRARVQWHFVQTEPVPVYQWLRDQRPRGPIFELPMVGGGAPFNYLLAQTDHHVPLINGTSGFAPPFDQQLNDLNRRNEFSDAFRLLLERQHAQLLIVHADALGQQEGAVLAWLRDGEAAGHFALLRRFDRGPKGDFVFAMTRSGAEWRALRSGARDAAGNGDRENWQRLLGGQPIYSSRPLLQFELPVEGAEFHTQLLVRGWAVAPARIRSVEVLVNNRSRVYAATRVPRPEINPAYPWFAHDEPAGFELTLPKRPAGVPKNTDLQIRIVDGDGKVLHSDDRAVRWH